MADENNRMTDGVANAAAAGAQGAEGMELGDDLLTEASGGTDEPRRGYIRLLCPICGWESHEMPFVNAADQKTAVRALEIGEAPRHAAEASCGNPQWRYVVRF